MVTTIDRIPTGRPAVGRPEAPPGGPAGAPESGRPGSSSPADASFRDALTAAAGERSLQLSGHAMRRLEQRQIPLEDGQLDRLQRAMETLSQRGSRQSLVMLDQVAYVVHVPSHTVVTAVKPDDGKDRVFDKIDSVVIA